MFKSHSLAQLAAWYRPAPARLPFWLLGCEVTPQPRPQARTLEDRSYVYQPNLVKSNKPITIGHAYSSVVLLPEEAYAPGPAWGVPVGVHRVKSSADKERVGGLQIEALLDDKELPCYAQLCVQVEDSGYSKPAFLAKNRAKTNRVTITRARTNRTFDRPPAQTARAVGPPTWYGAPVALPDPTPGPTSDATATTAMRRLSGQTYQVQLAAWPNMRLPGKCKPAPLPMRLYPFTLVRLRLLNAPGELAFQRPLWRMGMGERRRELSVLDSFQADQRRYDMEHFFRFGKQRLLLDRYPTPDAEHQEQWWRLVHLAYRQLGVARPVAQAVPRPWETAPAASPQQPLSPTHVQRDFGRIIRQFGTPAAAPKRRGNSAGRPTGMVWPHRPNAAVVYQAQT